MKNSTIKALAAVALLAIAFTAYSRLNKKKATSSALLPSAAVIPDSFDTKKDATTLDTYTSYWKADGKYYTQLMGPTVRSTPKEITQAEYTAAYQKYLA